MTTMTQLLMSDTISLGPREHIMVIVYHPLNASEEALSQAILTTAERITELVETDSLLNDIFARLGLTFEVNTDYDFPFYGLAADDKDDD